MKIDYVVVSSDTNPMYSDFYPIVSKKWNQLGFDVIYLKIDNHETELKHTEYGLMKTFKAVEGIDTGFQSQVVRIYASMLFDESKNIMMSDIDMLPLNSDYFSENALKANENEILIYSGQPYDNPYFPSCYILGNTNILKNIFELENNYDDFIKKLASYSKCEWNTDEHYMYDKLIKYNNKIILERDFNRRVDRIDNDRWKYPVDENLLKAGYYIDSHMIRPYSKYKKKIDKLL